MKIKDLRKLLKTLPANMEVMVDTGLMDYNFDGYGSVALSVRKAKTKLVKKINAFTYVQSRPHKDDKAKLVLIIE